MSATKPEHLSIAELARRLALPESTTRYYCKRFSEYLPSSGQGRTRRYAPEAVDALRLVAETMRRSKNAYAVDMALQSAGLGPKSAPPALTGRTGKSVKKAVTHGEIVTSPAGHETLKASIDIMSLLERQTEALQQIASAMALFASQHPAARQHEETLALRGEMQNLRRHIQESEENHKKDLEQTRTWLARFSEALAQRKV